MSKNMDSVFMQRIEERDPYYLRNVNPKNKWITVEHMENIFKKFDINHKVNNIENYRPAFIHSSYIVPTDEQRDDDNPLAEGEFNDEQIAKLKESIPLQKNSYERYEFLGDRVLDLIVGDYIYHRYDQSAEGFLTKLKTKLVRGTSLCILAKKLKFEQFILVTAKYDELRNNDKILEDVFEAFIAAIYIDFGCHAEAFGICKDFIMKLMERYLNFSQIVLRNDNYKDLLLQYYHKHFKKENGMGYDPEYVTISTYGPTHNRTYKAGVKNIDGHVIATGEGKRLKEEAQQIAAKNALKYYGEEVYSDTEEPTQEIYSDTESEEL